MDAINTRNRLDKSYRDTLDKVVAAYPDYKIDPSKMEYSTQLSALNGISNKLKALDDSVQEQITANESSVDEGTDTIKRLDQVDINLTEKSENTNDLDITSKQMLSDSVTRHDSLSILLWIKIGVIAVMVINQMHEELPILIMVGLTTCISSLSYIYISSL